MRRTRLLVVMVFVASLVGCATSNFDKESELPRYTKDIEVKVAYDPSAVFPKSGTYSWARSLHRLPDTPRLRMPLEERIQKAVRRELASKGYKFGGLEEFGFLVGYQVALEKNIDASANKGWLAYLGRAYREGSAI